MATARDKVLGLETEGVARDFFNSIIDLGISFKLQRNARERVDDNGTRLLSLIKELSDEGEPLGEILDSFAQDVLPYCTNFGSSLFMGFPDAGSSIAALGGGLLQELLQQNLINQSLCSPSATFAEIAVLNWLREAVGYPAHPVNDIWDVGGIITPGGTMSNTVGLMLARENKEPGTLERGVTDPAGLKIIVPKGIGHYSVKSAQMWLGCGNNVLEVDTREFRYDLHALKATLIENRGQVMALVAYAGDSRTMTVDNFSAIADMVEAVDPTIWLHADACHGFCLGFSSTLRSKLHGLERFDSVSADPHKVLLTPYTLSALLVREPTKLQTITSRSDLIMQEQFAFGQITPFVGSKPWMSLKLWFMMRHFGKRGLDELVTKRHETAIAFRNRLANDPQFVVLNRTDINSVAFCVLGKDGRIPQRLNELNIAIYRRMLDDGIFHLHQFSIADDGVIERGKIIYALRFMSGNPNITDYDLDSLVTYIKDITVELDR